MISYSVSIVDADAHIIDVRLDVDTPDPSGQILRLPNWIPGSYMIRDFSRHIVRIQAKSQSTVVDLQKLDKSTWKAPEGLASLSVHYRVYAWDLSVRSAHVDRLHAFFNGTSVFLEVVGQEHSPHEVCFERPMHDVEQRFEVATTLTAVTVDDAGYGLYRASDYDDLIDHPVEQGTFKRLRFEACGVPHEVVFTGACHFDEQRVIDDLQRICSYEITFFGEPAPIERYLFLVMVVDAGYGGLEHRRSTALMITRENLPVRGEASVSEAYLNFLGLCSHEYFHTWNVKRIKPGRFVPFELQRESYTELLWFFEGMTSYYDDLVLVRSGLIDEHRYLGLLAKTLTRIQRCPGRLSQTVTESSFDAWHKFYKQDENSPNAIVSYYAKGALVALCLDAILRERSMNGLTLDHLMRQLWTRWLETGKGLKEQEPQQLASEMLGSDLSSFFEQALYSNEELPASDALASLGVQLRWRARHSSSDMGEAIQQSPETKSGWIGGTGTDKQMSPKGQPWLGATIENAPGGVRILQVLSEGPAHRAGLAAGDLLIAINGLSIRHDDVDKHLCRYADQKQLTIHFFRLGQLQESTLAVESAPADTAVLQVSDVGRLRAWLLDSRESV